MLSSGCEDKRRHSASTGLSLAKSPAPLPADAPPDQVAETLLKAIVTAQLTRADGLGSPQRKHDYDAALAQIWALADRADIHEKVRSSHVPGIPLNVTEDAACTLIIESWISHLAYYVDGIAYPSKKVTPDQPQGDCTVHFDAVAPSDKAALASIESSLAKNPPKEDGKDAPHGTPAYLTAVRERSLPEGFNVPIEASIDIALKKTSDGWRAVSIGLSGARQRNRSVNVSSMPAKVGTTQ